MMAFGISVMGILIAGIIIGMALILLLMYLFKKKPAAPVEISVPKSFVSKSSSDLSGTETPAARTVEICVSRGGLDAIENKIPELSMFLHKKTIEEGQIIEFKGVSLKIEKILPHSPGEVTALTEINITLV